MVTVRLAALLSLWVGIGHPMHTSSAELSYDPAARRAELLVRVFADDFAALGADDAVRTARVAAGITVTAPGGQTVRLASGGLRRTADAVELRLSGPLDRGLSGIRVLDAVLFNRYGDQVNIVRVRGADRTTTILFTRGSGERTVP